VRYVSQHFMKASQAPPIGWRGHRYSATRDYLVRPAAVMRQEARASLRLKRLMAPAPFGPGLSLEEAELELLAAAATAWNLRDEMARAAREPFARRPR
jgi:hypothetical protein